MKPDGRPVEVLPGPFAGLRRWLLRRMRHTLWAHHTDGAEGPVHVWPINDWMAHDTEGGDCPCGPSVEPVPRADGSMGWLVTHHALDGRN